MSDFSLSQELMAQRCKAISAERQLFGHSVIAEVDRDMRRASRVSTADVYVSNDGANDGRISFKDKMINFGKGLISPITSMFSSPMNFAVGALSIVGGAALIALTGGAAAPVMVAAGLLGGGYQIAKGLYNQANATTDIQAANAWKDMGAGTITVGASALGAKSALKAAGTDTAGMSTWKAAGKCISDLPKYFKTCKTKLSSIFAGNVFGNKAQTTSSQPKLLEAPLEDKPLTGSETPINKQTVSEKTPKIVDKNAPVVDKNAPKPQTDNIIYLEAPKETPVQKKVEINADTNIGGTETPVGEIKHPKTKPKINKTTKQKIQFIKPNGEIVTIDITPPSYREMMYNKYKKIIESNQTKANTNVKPSFSSKLKEKLNVFGLFKTKGE